MTKIYIIGPVGSGKTTLAKRLSKELSIPFYELDNVVWEYHPDGDIRRSPKEIDKLFQKIINKDNWIIENVGKSYFDKGFDEADTIIYLNIPKLILYNRVLIRWIKQKLGIEKSGYKADIKMLIKMFEWTKNESKEDKLNKLKQYKNKLEILNINQTKNYIYKNNYDN